MYIYIYIYIYIIHTHTHTHTHIPSVLDQRLYDSSKEHPFITGRITARNPPVRTPPPPLAHTPALHAALKRHEATAQVPI